MARPRRVGSAEGQPPQPPAVDPPTQVEDMLDNMDDDGERTPEARVRRVDPATRKLALLDVVDAGVVDEPFMRENYGGGDYQVLIYGVRRDGKYGYLETKRYRVDASIPFKGSIRDRSMAGAVRTTGGEPMHGDDDSDMKMLFKSQLLNLVKEQNESRGTANQMLMQMMAQMQQSNQAFMSAMTQLLMQGKQGGGLGDLKEIIGPLITGAANRPDATETALKLITAMKGPDAPASNPLGLFKQFLEIRDLMSGGGGDGDGGKDEDSFMSIVKSIAPDAIGLLRDESKRLAASTPQLATPDAPVGTPRVVTPAPRIVAGAPIPAPVPVPPSPTPTPPVTDEWTPLEPEIARLTEFAVADKDPDDVAGLVMMFAPAERLAALKLMLAHDDLGSRIQQRFTALAPHADWLEDFLDALRERMGLPIPVDEGDDEPNDGDGGDGGDGGDDRAEPPPAPAIVIGPPPNTGVTGAVRIPVPPYDTPLAPVGAAGGAHP